MCQFFINEVIVILALKKGHRPPPNGGIPHALEPVIPGWSKEAFDLSASGQAAERRNHKNLRFEDDELNPEYVNQFTEMGVKKEVFDADHDEGRFRYNVHSPLDIKDGELLPMLYVSHGGMGTPFQAENWGFSELIAKERFIAVYANNGGYSNENTDTEFPRILKAMIRDYPIDRSRVYAFGFSSGSDATETAATLWPEKIAACVPAPGSNAMYNSLCRLTEEAYEKCLPLRMPCLFLGGTADYGDRWPFPDKECFENFNIWAEKICKVPEFIPTSLAKSRMIIDISNDPVERAAGLRFPVTYTFEEEEREWYAGEFPDENGHPILKVILAEGLPHVITDAHAPLAWEFLKHWSRDPETGELTYTD